MATRIYYRLSDDANNGHSLWSGAITVPVMPGKVEARRAVAKHLRCERLPARTLVVTDFELKLGKWTAEAIKEATTKAPKAAKVKRVKAFNEVPESFDQVQDMLKKFGLA